MGIQEASIKIYEMQIVGCNTIPQLSFYREVPVFFLIAHFFERLEVL